MYTAEYFISLMKMEPHIEGGYFKEIYKSKHSFVQNNLDFKIDGERPLSSTIYFLLKSGQCSKFHKIKSDEIWFYHYGAPIIVHMIGKEGNLVSERLGLDIEKGEKPQVLVPANTIFGAEIEAKDTFGLVSCMVSPGFDYKDFELFEAMDLIKKYPEQEKIIMRMNGKG